VTNQVKAWLGAIFHDLDTILHAGDYDPVKAREYYLRTRELKGREKGESVEPESVRVANRASAAAETKQQEVKSDRSERQAQLKAQLEELEIRVDQLNAAIKKAKRAAMSRAGVSEDTLARMITKEVKSPGSSKGMGDAKDEKGSDSDSDSSDKPKTAEQKRKAAKAAKEKYDEENPDSPEAADQALQDKIDETAEKLEKLQKRIEAINRVGA
jgi:hypothetical protein